MKLEKFYAICDSIPFNENGCQIWVPGKWATKQWYVNIYLPGRKISAHRLALERKLKRPVKLGYDAIHKCQNKRCVNPEHLLEGTRSENMREYNRYNTCPKLSASEIKEIMSLSNDRSISRKEIMGKFNLTRTIYYQVLRGRIRPQ